MIEHLTWICIAIGGFVASVIGSFWWGAYTGQETETKRLTAWYQGRVLPDMNAISEDKIHKLEQEIARITLESRGKERQLLDKLLVADKLAEGLTSHAEIYRTLCRNYDVPVGQLSGYIDVLRQCATRKGEKRGKTKPRRKA